MATKGFRKLEVATPRQPVVNTKPWAKAGWLLLLAIACLMAFFFFQHRS